MVVRSLAVLVLAVAGGNVSAEVVATCGASDGWSYFVPGGGNPTQKPAWEKDRISTGSFQLIRAGDDFDIIFTDVTGRTLSTKGDGGSLSGFITPDGDVVVLVLYPRLSETYVFWLSDENPTVSYSTAKYATPVPKHSLMVAPCRRGA